MTDIDQIVDRDLPVYYLYRHIRLDSNQVFYIGIGKVLERNKYSDSEKSYYHRAFNSGKARRNDFWYRIKSKTGYKVEILFESNDLEFIANKEIELISLYGRRDLRKGTLVNLNDGGQMPSYSEENKKHLSDLAIQRHKDGTLGFYGKQHTSEVVDMLRYRNNRGREIVQLGLNFSFIKDWKTAGQVMREDKIDSSCIIKCCKGKLEHFRGFKWMYKEDYKPTLNGI